MMCDCRSYWPSSQHHAASFAPSQVANSHYYQHLPAGVGHHQQQQQQQQQSPPPQSVPVHQPHVDLRAYYYDYAYSNSSSRQMRNQAEKQRRDKLNQFINELALLVPMVSSSAKKLDKTSILRLSATFLRIHQILIGEMPKNLSNPMCHFLKSVFDGEEGMLMVVTSTGKIVFMTENVEQYLGHHQNDLLGQSLFNITHMEDHEELKLNLKPREEEELIKIDGEETRRPERRSFFLRLKQRTASKSDQPQYEMVQVEGHLRVPRQHLPQGKSKTQAFERYLKAHLSPSNGGYTDTKGDNGANSNDIVLVALVRPYKERRMSENSILEATKEEWFTRHLLDGTIVFADHRISILSGYMSEEVSGDSAFKFMHKDDVRWVMIALRQMFCKGESYGWSAYRLQIKNGEYIYLRTQGYLELEEGTQTAKSFICVNTLLEPNEGETMIAEMKRIFTPLVQKNTEPLAAAIDDTSSMSMSQSPDRADSPGESVALRPIKTDEPRELNLAIDLLLSDLSQVIAHPPPPEKRNQDYSKVEIVSKSLPSIEVQSERIGAKLPNLVGKYNRPSVITSITGSSERQKRPPENLGGMPESETKRLRSENRSVIVSDVRSVIKRHEPEPFELDTNFMFNTDLLLTAGTTTFSHISDDDSLRLPEEANSSELWDSPVSDLEERVFENHLHLENRIQSQENQIEEIEEDLQTVPLSSTNVYRSHITHLKAETRKQREMLKTLQHDHQNINQVKG